jgi:hypothetical protein
MPKILSGVNIELSYLKHNVKKKGAFYSIFMKNVNNIVLFFVYKQHTTLLRFNQYFGDYTHRGTPKKTKLRKTEFNLFIQILTIRFYPIEKLNLFPC